MQQEPREQHWQSLLFIVSVLIFSTGVYFYLKNRHTRGMQHVTSLPPPVAAPPERQITSEDPPRMKEEASTAPEEGGDDLAKKETSSEHETDRMSADQPENERLVKTQLHVLKHASARLKDHFLGGDDSKQVCESIDAFVEPDPIFVTKKDWEAVVKEFRASKKRLLIWLEANENKIPHETAELMEFRIKSLRIYGAPWKKEPNLRWSKIGFWMVDADGSPSIAVSPGFVEFAKMNPKRAKFEMTRWVTQTWSPCELERLGGAPIWKDLLTCLGQKSDLCGTEGYSESGWAISTVLGSHISPPGCQIPALEEVEEKKCIQTLLAPIRMGDDKKEEPKSGVQK